MRRGWVLAVVAALAVGCGGDPGPGSIEPTTTPAAGESDTAVVDLEVGNTTTAEGLPLPVGAEPAESGPGESFAITANRNSVARFYDIEIADGQAFGDWEWCERLTTPATDQWVWTQDGDVLVLNVTAGDGGSLILVGVEPGTC